MSRVAERVFWSVIFVFSIPALLVVLAFADMLDPVSEKGEGT